MRAGWREVAGCSVFGELSRVPKLTLTEAHEERKEECCKPVYFHQISSLVLLTALGSGEPAGVTVPDRHRGPEFLHLCGKVKIWDVHFWNSNLDAFILGFIFRILAVSSWSCCCFNLPILTLKSEFCTFMVIHQALALNSEFGFHGFSSELFC